MTIAHHSNSRRRAGAVAVEFAIATPVVVLFALACVDMGRVSNYYGTVVNAARSGAEAGATMQLTDLNQVIWEQLVREAVVDEMTNLNDFDEDKLEFDLLAEPDGDGKLLVQVDVTYPFETAIRWPALPSVIPLTQHVEFRQFR